MSEIDNLQIEIKANAEKANDSLDKLNGKLNTLSNSLKNLNTSSLTGLANGVKKLGSAMQTMNTIKTSDFNRLVKNIQKIGTINTSALNSTASSLSHITRTFNQLGTVSSNAKQIGVLVKNLSKFGNKSIQNAITNIPQLAISINQLITTLSKAPKVSQNLIQMLNALSNFTSQSVNISNSLNSIVNALNRTNNSAQKTKKSFGGLASSIGKFYATWFFVIRGVKSLGKSVESTADYIEAFNYFNVALGKIGSDWSNQFEKYGYENAEAYAKSFSQRLQKDLSGLSGLAISTDASGNGLLSSTGTKNLGLNIQEITQFASQLASVTNSVGQTGEVSLATANAFTKLGADMSSLFNLDYSSVMKNLQSGLIGQSRALYKYGIDITNATLQTYAYELGLSKAVSEMTQAEKMQLRMIAILNQSKVSWGDLANTINSPSNMLRQFSNNLKEVGMVLGQLFIPLMQKVMPVINGITIAIKNLLTSIAGFFGIKLDLSSFGQGFSEIEEDADEVTESLENLNASAKKLSKQSFDNLNVITTPTDSGASSIGGLGSGIDLTQQILDATAEYERVWQEAFDRMENQAEVFAKKVEKALAPVKSLFKNIAIGDWFAVGQDVTNIVVGITDFFTRAIENVDWEQIGENIGLFIKGIDFTTILSSVGHLIWEAINAGIDLYGETFNTAPLETTIFSAIALLNFTPLGGMLATKIATSLSASLSSSGVISILGIGFKSLFSGAAFDGTLALFSSASILLAGIGSILSGLLLSVTSFVSQFTKGFNIIKEAIMVVGIALTAVGAIILGAPALVAGVIAAIVAAVSTLAIIIKDNWQSISLFFKNLATAFSVIWENIAYVITTNVLPEIERKFINFINGIIGFFEGMVNGVISGINFIVKGLNKIKFDVPSWVPGIGGKKFGFNISLVKDVYIPRFETGGFPEDGWFRASKGEYFGKFDDGTSYIGTNRQIENGVASGVYGAVRDGNAEQNALLREQNALLRQILAKDTGISTRDVFEAVRTENREYINRNGESAFAF